MVRQEEEGKRVDSTGSWTAFLVIGRHLFQLLLLDTGTTDDSSTTEGDTVVEETPVYIIILILNLPNKRRKIEKKSKSEKSMEKAIVAFLKYQKEAEERFVKFEEERWQKEVELEEKRRKQEQEHGIRMMEMMGQMFGGRNAHSYGGMYNFNDSDY